MKRTSLLLAGSLSLGALVAAATPAFAEGEASFGTTPSVSELMSNSRQDSIGQVTSVSQLSDVQPTDWAFQALQSLVERYGCIAGYPDGTFRGNRAATRYELAAALNACLDQISDRFATQEDLEAVRALQEEFAAELATLRGRVDSLEARTATLEAQQFSTTTKLQGEVVMAAQYGDFTNNSGFNGANAFAVPQNDGNPQRLPDGTVGGINPSGAAGPFGIPVGPSRASVLARVRLNFNTSFSGTDLLQTQLEVGNNGNDFFGGGVLAALGDGANPIPLRGLTTGPAGLVDLGGVDYAGVGNTVILRRLAYSFQPFENFTFTLGPQVFPSDFIDFNSYANNSAQDFSSGFFINNALIINNIVDTVGGAGAAFDWNVNGGPFSVRGLFVSAGAGIAAGRNTDTFSIINGNFIDTRGGVLDDPYQASAEIEYANTFGSADQNSFAARLQYTYSESARVRQNVVGANLEATFGQFGVFGRYGLSIDPRISLNGAQAGVGGLNVGGPGLYKLLNPTASGDVDNLAHSWMAGVGVKDLFVPGSLLAGAVGMPYMIFGDNQPEQLNVEAFYRFPVNDNITITPAVMYITNVANTGIGANQNNDVIQGLIRATFSF
ncbi:iron uptake porin [Synechococcales cyanobacterium C]|uniref:Iron uptake porin n=1 Tax=Petrachloros mirabilis ULC683 TaxID=2781853 RepID=A0A8K2AN99_9CYAN|nr:iron uptake porin [Petrachloros mirabilis]NCJ05091.1 iron uptake porin [Petrachloros mirabilis ULC683]